LQWLTHVRDSDSVTLRENVTRRRIARHDNEAVRRGLVLTLAVLLALAGCGGTTGGDRPNQDATLLLDSAPSAVHAGIYLARERGYDEAEGVTLRVRAPSAPGDGARLLRAGRVDMAILDLHRLALARERGADLVGVMAVVQRPLTRSAPLYPELVLAVTRQTLAERRPVVRAAIRALQRGYLAAQDDPDSALSAMTTADPALDRAALAPQLDAVAPAFTAGAQTYGQLRPAALRAWARRDHAATPLDVSRAFDTTLVGPAPEP
jgi:ABC-type nitrate/sulfonate/bicarbonate transport system substrate-binding protein